MRVRNAARFFLGYRTRYRNPFRTRRAFANTLAESATVVRAFSFLKFFGQRFFPARPAHRCHGFHSETIRDLDLGFGAFVIKPLHAMDDQPLIKSL